jgi:hypothetical protein
MERQIMYLKQMQLCDTAHRASTDLRNYALDIEKCIYKVMPDVAVEVSEKYFTIMSDYEQTTPDAVSIGVLMGKTDLGKLCKTHYYKKGSDGSLGISNKIFIEVRKPKGKIIIDDGTKEREIEAVLNEMSEDSDQPVNEQQLFADIPIEELERETSPSSCECWDCEQEPCQCA